MGMSKFNFHPVVCTAVHAQAFVTMWCSAKSLAAYQNVTDAPDNVVAMGCHLGDGNLPHLGHDRAHADSQALQALPASPLRMSSTKQAAMLPTHPRVPGLLGANSTTLVSTYILAGKYRIDLFVCSMVVFTD